jgi:acyl dehydratase
MATRTDEMHVGRLVGRREIDITPELVSHYGAAVEDFNPWYSGPSPFGGPVAPALLLHSEVYHTIEWYLSVFGNLHARQEWELFQPTMVGETVSAHRMIVDRYIKRDREYVVNEVACFGADGRMLNRGRTHQSFLLDATPREGSVVDKDREKRPDRKFQDDVAEPIEEILGPEKTISIEMCQKFSGPGKNYHNDREHARKLGFPDIVVQGMMSLCFISEMMTERFGEGWFVGGRMNVNLVNVLWQGETVRARGIVHEITPEGPRRRAHLRVSCQKADGTTVVAGAASAVLP